MDISTDVSFHILGPLEVTVGGRRVTLGGQQATMLGYLLAQAPRIVSLSHLMNVIWDDDPPDSAKRLVQNTVSALRRTLADAGAPGPVIVADGPGYRVSPAAGSLDADVFADLVATADRLVAAGDAGRAVDQLAAGLDLWRGPALSGLTGRIVEAVAARIDERRLSAAELRFELELGLGRHREVVGELGDLVTAHPQRERLIGSLMLALHRCGRQAEAVHIYQRLRRDLREELGLDPGPAVQEAYAAMLAGEPDQATEAPPPSAIEATPVPKEVPAQLPADLSGFTGREQYLRTLDEMLEPGVGVASIAGMAGIGKPNPGM